MSWPRRLLTFLLGDYELYRVFEVELSDCEVPAAAGIRLAPITDPQVVLAAPDSELRTSAAYAGDEALGYGAWVDDELVGVEWVWYGERYRKRNFWPLGARDAKSVQTTVARSHRGRGLARLLLLYAKADLARRGFRRVYARIWHSNAPSVAVYRRAGWREIAFVATVYPLGLRRPLRLVFHRRHSRRVRPDSGESAA